ncbi:hypothetical protein Q0590_28220 [Rhodocytophaga aerolata]|uniref:Bacterial CdiA-CT RNAse A domain-containing protein n=1 Tax=Rhodocytophaga aerolata TaxID=455078 RepID=A0ABT8RE04_9BACT|nr:hypothetical protein [Rhodocytophaga aerolata]MDO1450199.1 hypothetical protein [Rhodocytophaga aerolata]
MAGFNLGYPVGFFSSFARVSGGRGVNTVSATEATAKVATQSPRALSCSGPVDEASKLAANAERNIALGVTEHLDDFARNVGGTTWKTWGNKDFQSQFLSTINDPANRIHFNLTGPDGRMINAWQAVTEGSKGVSSRATSWELFQIYSNPNALKRTTFYYNGEVVPSPY